MQATSAGCGPLKVVPVRLLNVFLPRLTLIFIWSGGVLQLLQAAAGLFQCAQVVGRQPGNPCRSANSAASPSALRTAS